MRLSVFLQDCRYLSKPVEGSVHGAFLATLNFFRWVANDSEFDKLEVFLPPAVMTDPSALSGAAEATLRPESRGKGRLSFYAVHHLPEVWADGVPRILRGLDPHSMARDRYLRDAFCAGPIALNVDTHVMASYEAWKGIEPVLRADPVPFDSLQCLSRSMQDSFRVALAEMGCEQPPFRLDRVSRPIDCERFRPPTPAERAHARRQFDVPENATVAMFHSRVGPHSKADLYPLVQAFAKASGPNDWLVVSGGQTSDSAYETLAMWLKDAGVMDRSRLLRGCPHEEVPGRLWLADFFVLPCDNPSEGIGIAPVEAMATGLPAIVSDWDGMKEGVCDGVNGYRVPTYWVPGSARLSAFSPFVPHQAECLLLAQCVVVDAEIFAERMALLFRDAGLREKLGAAARESALEFSSERIGQKLTTMFCEQIELATAEAPEARERRRSRSRELALPSPYQSILSRQGSRVLQGTETLELTKQGKELVAGNITVPTYQEVGLLSSGQVTAQILERLARGPSTFDTLVQSIAVGSFEDCGYSVAVLLKRGTIKIAG